MNEQIPQIPSMDEIDPKEWITPEEWAMGATAKSSRLGITRYFWAYFQRENGPDFPRCFPARIIAWNRARYKAHGEPNLIVIIPESQVPEIRELASEAQDQQMAERELAEKQTTPDCCVMGKDKAITNELAANMGLEPPKPNSKLAEIWADLDEYELLLVKDWRALDKMTDEDVYHWLMTT